MTQAELYTMLTSLGLPVAYRAFKEPTDPPFICYIFQNSGDLMADNANTVSLNSFDIEFYADEKDLTNESAIEALLKANKMPYRKYSAWIESEKLEETIYEIQITD